MPISPTDDPEEPEEPEESEAHESIPGGGPSLEDVRKIIGTWLDGSSVEKSIERNAREAMHQDEIGDDYWLKNHERYRSSGIGIPAHLNLQQFYRSPRGKLDPPV